MDGEGADRTVQGSSACGCNEGLEGTVKLSLAFAPLSILFIPFLISHLLVLADIERVVDTRLIRTAPHKQFGNNNLIYLLNPSPSTLRCRS